MHTHPNTPVHGNWIWLATATITVVLLAVSALSYHNGACQAAHGPARVPGAAVDARAVDARARAGGDGARQRAASGLALYYHPGTALGSCALGPFPPGGLYVSLPVKQYARGAACGSYLDVRGPRGSVRAEVVDLCTGCRATTINLSEAAFARVADPRPGSARVTYRDVANPRLSGPLVVRVFATANPGAVALQILNHGNRITSVAAATDPGGASLAGATAVTSAGAATVPVQWRPFSLGANGFWVSVTGLGDGPFALRITDDRGHEAVLRRLGLQPGDTIRRHVWMYPATAWETSRAAALPPAQPAAAAVPSHC